MYKDKITKEELDKLPLKSFEGETIVVDDYKKYTEAVKKLQLEAVIGFDTETKPAFKKGVVNSVALIQLATSECAYLFRLNKVSLREDLRKILSDENVLKIGVALRDDVKQLCKLAKFEPAGFIELQEYVKDYGILDNSLKKLAAIVLDIRISKSQRVSNWENPVLTEGQVKYAATDAWVPYEIFKKLETQE